MASNRSKWKTLFRAVTGAVVALTGSAVSVVGTGGLASAAATVPPWEPDPQAAAPYGNIVFYDANGNQVTSGTNLSNPFAWAVATTAADSGSVKATLAFYKPVAASPPNPQVWPGVSEGGPTAFNPATPAGTPPSVAAFAPTYPVVKATPNISSFASAEGTDPTAGYTDMIEVRMQDTALFGSQSSYWDTDIAYNTTASPITVNGLTVPANSWVQVFPPATTTTTGLTTSASGGTLPIGQQITLTATVPSSDSGTVNFFDNGTFLANQPATSGTATYQYTPGGGSQSYTATFVPGPVPGDETGVNTSSAKIIDGSTSNPVVVNVQAPATTTTVTSTGPTVVGQPVTYTATVAADGATVDAGNVSFADNGTAVTGCGSAPVTNGQATCNTTPTTAGSHSIVATYVPGTAPFQGSDNSASPFVQTVSQAGTSVTMTTSPPSPVGVNTPVTLQATVTVDAPGAGAPTGTVTFKDGTTTLCSGSLSATSPYTASCAHTFSSVGPQSLTALYGGDPNFNPATSPAGNLVVNPATTIAVTSSANPSVTGQPVTYTATVTVTSPGTGHPTGSVSFSDGGTPIATCGAQPLSNGSGNTSIADCSIPAGYQASGGSHSITASYPGDSDFGGSATASPLIETVNAADTTTTVVSSTNPSLTGQSVTYTATVAASGSGSGTPAGTVTFSDGTTPTCSDVNLSAGSATCTVSYPSVGTHSITAAFAGTADFNMSTSAPAVAQVVGTDATTTSVTSSANPSLTGQSVIYTATVAANPPGAGTPAGTVTFSEDGTAIGSCTNQNLTGGKATCAVTYSSAGSHTITAAFTDTDNNYGDSDSTAQPLTETVQAVIPPAAPTGLKATAADGQITLVWNAVPTAQDGGSPVTGYNVYMSTAPGGEIPPPVNAASANTCTKPISGTTYNATGLTDGTTYYFTVTACNVAGESVPSAEVSATPQHSGYFLVGNDGGVFAFGNATFRGSLGGVHLRAPIVGMAQTPDKGGYWLVGADGGVFTFGDAPFLGSLGKVHLEAPIVGITATSTGKGYWLVAADGGVFSFGDAPYLGSLGSVHLNSPILGMVATHDNGGYLLVGADGGVFSFGDAPYLGSLGNLQLAAPIVGIAMTADQQGYWLVGLDGGVFTFGDAKFHGSLGGTDLAAPIVGIQPSFDGGGYLLFGTDGGVFAFGDAPYHGSLPAEGVKVDDITGAA